MGHITRSIVLVAIAATVSVCPAQDLMVSTEDQESRKFGLDNPPARTDGAIRVATYNVLNLFDHDDDPKLKGELEDLDFAVSKARAETLALAIRAIDADILALQEVESKAAITWFRDTYLPHSGYQYVASHDCGDPRGIECSVLSRFPITSSRAWPQESLNEVTREGIGWSSAPNGEQLLSHRSPLMANIQVNDEYALTLFIVHHRAGRDSDYQRESEALRTVERIDELRRSDPSQNIIVMGDFNAAPWDKSVRVYLEAGLIDVFAHRTIQRDNPESLLYKTHESHRVLDYILLNSAAHREFVIGSEFVYGTLYPPEDYNFRTDPYPEGYASDHYPVVIDLIPNDRL